jgi:hypothetical protein
MTGDQLEVEIAGRLGATRDRIDGRMLANARVWL